jgi:hypothetical protein
LYYQLVVRNAQILDGTGSGAHTMFDMCALESRAGSTGNARHFTTVVKTYFRVCADVYRQRNAGSFREACSKNHGDMISAYITGNVGQKMHVRADRYFQSEIARLYICFRTQSRHIRRKTKLIDGKFQEKVMNRRITDNYRVHYSASIDACFGAQRHNGFVKRFHKQRL